MTTKTRLALIALAVLALAGPAAARTLHQERSLYRNIVVDEADGQRCLLFRARRGLGRESCMYLDNPKKFVFEYASMTISALYMNPTPPKKVLIIGLGGATLPTALEQMLPGARIDVVELDPAVDKAARAWFNYKPGRNVSVTISDGRVFVKRAIARKPNYDLVILDAFEDDYIPEHMMTKDFLEEVKQIMAPNGVLAANTWTTSGFYPYESATYAAAFGPFYSLKSDNRIIITRLSGLPSMDEIRKNAATWEPAFAERGAHMATLIPMFSSRVDWDPKTRVLTDQFSPANVLNAK